MIVSVVVQLQRVFAMQRMVQGALMRLDCSSAGSGSEEHANRTLKELARFPGIS